MSFEGVHAPLVTPFKADGEIAHELLGKHAVDLAGRGLTGLGVGGTTGEYYALSFEERVATFHTVAQAAGGKTFLTAGINATTTREVLRLGQGAEAYLEFVEGNATDRWTYLAMIAAAVVVLARRRIRWRDLISTNKWVLLYFVFFALSTLWSDDPLVAFKRWIKDFGNLLMVVIILTDRHHERLPRQPDVVHAGLDHRF